MPPCGLSGAAMLASLAYLTLSHPESDIPGHTGPIPLELKTLSHPPISSMSLLMSVSQINFRRRANGQTTLSRSR